MNPIVAVGYAPLKRKDAFTSTIRAEPGSYANLGNDKPYLRGQVQLD